MERTDYLMPQTKQALLDWKEHQMLMRKRRKIDPNGSDLVFSTLMVPLLNALTGHGGQPLRKLSMEIYTSMIFDIAFAQTLFYPVRG